MENLQDGVSFVVTVYNKERFLPLVLEALSRQRGDFQREFIFVDDGSTDGSLRILNEATRNWSNVTIISQRNAGPSRAFNRALEEAKFSQVKALDGDDILLPDATIRLRDALIDGCRLAFGHGLTYEEIPGSVDELYCRQDGDDASRPTVVADFLWSSLTMSRMAPSCWLASTSLLRDCGGCDERIFVQDYSLELRMVARTPVAVLERPIYFFQGPVDQHRVSANVRQILFDGNRAMANFFSDHPHLIGRYGWFAARRAAGRAWRWSFRHEGKTIFSADCWRFVQSRLCIGDPVRLISDSCASFGEMVRV